MLFLHVSATTYVKLAHTHMHVHNSLFAATSSKSATCKKKKKKISPLDVRCKQRKVETEYLGVLPTSRNVFIASFDRI